MTFSWTNIHNGVLKPLTIAEIYLMWNDAHNILRTEKKTINQYHIIFWFCKRRCVCLYITQRGKTLWKITQQNVNDGYLWLIELSLFFFPQVTVLIFFKSETKRTTNLPNKPTKTSQDSSAPCRALALLRGLLSLKVWEPCAPVKATLCPQKPRGWMQEDGQAVLLPGRPQEAQGLWGLASQEAVLDAHHGFCPLLFHWHLWGRIKGNHRVQTELRILERDDSSYGNSGGGEGMPRQPVQGTRLKRRFLQLLTWAWHCSCSAREGHMASNSSGL